MLVLGDVREPLLLRLVHRVALLPDIPLFECPLRQHYNTLFLRHLRARADFFDDTLGKFLCGGATAVRLALVSQHPQLKHLGLVILRAPLPPNAKLLRIVCGRN